MAKNLEIKGAERKSNKELDELAETYRKFRDKRMALGEKEEEARANLAGKLISLGMKPDTDAMAEQVVYRYDDGDKEREIIWQAPRVKVKGAKSTNGTEADVD